MNKKDWKKKTLGEVCKLYQPTTISTKEMVADGPYNVFGANGIIGKYDKYNHEFSEITMTCRGATCGHINITTPKSWINGNAMVIHINDETLLNRKFLVYQLLFIDKKHIITGAAQPQITRQTLSPLLICVPSLSEQEEIVKKLDAAFAEIDALKANSESQLLEARALFQAALSKELSPKNNWQKKTLKEIGKTQTGTTPSMKNQSNYGDYIPFIRPSEIDFDGCGGIKYDSEVKLSETGVKNGRLFKQNSIFMVCIGTVGKIGYSIIDVSCNQQINVLTPNEKFNYKFLYYAMRNKNFNDLVIKIAKSAQATLPIINKTKWENLSIFVPSLSAQEEIVARLDALSENVRKLEEINRRTIAECDALRQSILRQIFD